jgi:hypothetical protein
MNQKPVPILHVDGSLTEYVDRRGVLHKIAGLGGYLVIDGKVIDKFTRTLKDLPHMNHHEEYAIIEGLKWLREKRINQVKVKTDSLPSIHLFNHSKKKMTKEDKYFLVQYMMLEFTFEGIELIHHSRSDDDLSHLLSRSYLEHLPKNITRLHAQDNKKVSDYHIVADAAYHEDREIKRSLSDKIKELQLQFLIK